MTSAKKGGTCETSRFLSGLRTILLRHKKFSEMLSRDSQYGTKASSGSGIPLPKGWGLHRIFLTNNWVWQREFSACISGSHSHRRAGKANGANCASAQAVIVGQGCGEANTTWNLKVVQNFGGCEGKPLKYAAKKSSKSLTVFGTAPRAAHENPFQWKARFVGVLFTPEPDPRG